MMTFVNMTWRPINILLALLLVTQPPLPAAYPLQCPSPPCCVMRAVLKLTYCSFCLPSSLSAVDSCHQWQWGVSNLAAKVNGRCSRHKAAISTNQGGLRWHQVGHWRGDQCHIAEKFMTEWERCSPLQARSSLFAGWIWPAGWMLPSLNWENLNETKK